ncbi:MAG: group III truncated hemoglobin [Sphingopyxis sp.]|uniref:group III truncated hemoglobin n=1 Tax=Sphingopyxis sp. TaxID=1908224 RepID=UPI002AB829BD|nr:group III truncated hemoglobin [Sphingopyxis sp.]MDZ3830480.1 group III truncated hemoglobin [Sphingopyxis sp.]
MTTTSTHPHAHAAREKRRTEASAIGIDEAFIATFVDDFYTAIRADALLGPIFAAHIDDWPAHLAQMNRFWQSILLSAGNFTGNPMVKHLAIPSLNEAHFVHWLRLFYATLARLAPTPEAAQLVGEKARMIADSLLSAIWVHRDHTPDRKGELPHVQDLS